MVLSVATNKNIHPLCFCCLAAYLQQTFIGWLLRYYKAFLSICFYLFIYLFIFGGGGSRELVSYEKNLEIHKYINQQYLLFIRQNLFLVVVEKYADMLKDRYKHGPVCDPVQQWPPQQSGKFIRLHLKQITQEPDTIIRVKMTGREGEDKRDENAIELQDIFKKTNEQMTIVFEGCPGSGKTALTLHLCKEWADGKMFNDYKLVVLVRLREPAIQSAKEIKHILPRIGSKSDLDDIAKVIDSRNGSGVLFILDGWDELPQQISGYFTISEIICRHELTESDVVITSRQTSTASLHLVLNQHQPTRIEILGFDHLELYDYFTKCLDGDASKADKLWQKIKKNPSVEGTCAIPLNASILVHVFQCDGDLPETEHGIFEALIRNCILHHIKKRNQLKIKKIMSLDNLPSELEPQYHELHEIAYKGVIEDQVIFELDEDFDTLGLLQGVECFTSYGTEYFYTFFHLSIQEFLAAHHIATAFKPAEQVAEFNTLFGKARFSSTFRHYSCITKLTTPGIEDVVLRIVKQGTADKPSIEDKACLLSLIHCLHEAKNTFLYKFVAENLGKKLDLSFITLNPTDCLSISYLFEHATEIYTNLRGCSVDAEGLKQLLSQGLVYRLHVLK